MTPTSLLFIGSSITRLVRGAMQNLIRDESYNRVDPNKSHRLLDTEPRGRRAPGFDEILNAINDSFFDPLNQTNFDFTPAVDLKNRFLRDLVRVAAPLTILCGAGAQKHAAAQAREDVWHVSAPCERRKSQPAEGIAKSLLSITNNHELEALCLF
jgi:hypothetical protein